MKGASGKRSASPTILIVGGGLAGLAAALHAARGGARVIVLERARNAGGRALTRVNADGVRFNLGPHALYASARARLADLGVEVTGGAPSRYFASEGECIHLLPLTTRSVEETTFLAGREKPDAARTLSLLSQASVDDLAAVSLQDWLDENVETQRVRSLIEAVARLTTLTNDPEKLSAGAFVGQMQAGGVIYPDGGWGAIVAGLRAAAEAAGVVVRTQARVASVVHEPSVHGVHLADGDFVGGDAVILAVAPDTAAGLAPRDPGLARAAEQSVPVETAWVDIALRYMPPGARSYGLAVERPLYFAEHSSWAKLAPGGRAAVVTARFLKSGQRIAREVVRRELEEFADLLAPGWRNALLEARFFPRMRAMEAMPLAARGGLPGRPPVDAPSTPGLFVTGDWVRSRRLLADGVLETAEGAANAALAYVGFRGQRNGTRAR